MLTLPIGLYLFVYDCTAIIYITILLPAYYYTHASWEVFIIYFIFLCMVALQLCILLPAIVYISTHIYNYILLPTIMYITTRILLHPCLQGKFSLSTLSFCVWLHCNYVYYYPQLYIFLPTFIIIYCYPQLCILLPAYYYTHASREVSLLLQTRPLGSFQCMCACVQLCYKYSQHPHTFMKTRVH